MKSLKNGYYKIYNFENLYKAHLKARRGKRNKGKVIEFEKYLNCNLVKIQKDLQNKTYRMNDYRIFKIHEPKLRTIMALNYRDRVVQHSLCDNVLGPYICNLLIYDNCAAQVGKGTHFGLDRVKYFMRDYYNRRGINGWIIKGDIKNYFYSIDHAVLKANLYRKIKDIDLKWLLDLIINSINGEKGIPIGNLTSQFFGVFYLDLLDRFVKENLKIKYYSRYMDDFVAIVEDRKYAKECLDHIREFLKVNLKLELNKKSQIFPLKNGVDYLGFHTYLTESGKVIRKVRKASKKKIKRKVRFFVRKFKDDKIDYETIRSSIASWKGHISHGNTYNLRKKVNSMIVL